MEVDTIDQVVEEQLQYPRVLVISSNCFSATSSNGRTLGNFFRGWPKDKLAQFYLSGDNLDFTVCNNFFNVTDEQALSAFKGGKCFGGVVAKEVNKESRNSKITKKTETGESKNTPVRQVDSKEKKKTPRNSITMMLRNMIWRSGRWKSCGFNKWVMEFAPEVVLLQAGDFAFMYELSRKVAKRQNAKLVIYNSEGYYFKDFDYFRSSGIAKMMYPVFLSDLKKALRRTYACANYIIYLCDELTKAYAKEFKVPSETIYTASDMAISPAITENREFIISYCGNLGIERHKCLIEVASILQEISPELHIDVYGRAREKRVEDELKACPGIRFHGFVQYDVVNQVIAESDLVLHVESFDDFYKEDLKFGFSTKIADLLSSGKCFLLYAPDCYACSKYLIENEAAYVVSEKSKLKDTLVEIVNNPQARGKYRQRALKLAEKNHRSQKNVERFQRVLCDVAMVVGESK
ncbi:glycosyltransferase family 1 protein [Eubacterium sp. ER2]|uniref:glycosyltransferase family protein n=1 Tax=Eubacterium sp. ER2 TaxID=1519438 RepID=UPI00051C8DBD|nr:glycosyltransferase family 1 protein [Eubacterium sp. ER2]